ncbi:MAG: TSUP family transporter, partial [Acetobacteraceae bacterium]|nr:TSUP family transporter [Acetobacteraceae bacterium]
VGAGTLSGPTLALLGAPLPGVVGAGAAFNLAVALPSVTAFVAAGWAEPGLPRASLGHVALVPLALLVAPALAVTPWAAGMAARLPVPALRRIFALCLLVVAARMAARALT